MRVLNLGVYWVATVSLGGLLVVAGLHMFGVPWIIGGTVVQLLGSQVDAGLLIRGVQAAGAFEVFSGVALLGSRLWGQFTMATWTCIGAFVTYDAARFLSGHGPDCGCFGDVLVLEHWWLIVLKHAVIISMAASSHVLVPSAGTVHALVVNR